VLLRGTSIVVPSVLIIVLRVLPVRHRSQELRRVGDEEERAGRKRTGSGRGKIVAPGNCGFRFDRRGGIAAPWPPTHVGQKPGFLCLGPRGATGFVV
jgi:hypothetical protein